MLPALVLATFASAIFYVRLLNGPVSLAPLATLIARSMSAELDGFTVSVEDAIVRLTPSSALEFRLRDVRVNDADGQPVAIAPLAAMSLSQSALWSGRITPEQVVLIEPRLLLQIGSGSSGGGGTPAIIPARAPRLQTTPLSAQAAGDPATPAIAADPDGTALRKIEVTRVIRDAIARARQRSDAVTYLKKIGLKQAAIIVDDGTRQTVVRVLNANIDLQHKKRRSMVSGWASLASGREPWQIDFRAEEAEKTEILTVTVQIADAVPAAISDVMPNLVPKGSALAALDAPVGAELTADFARDGGLIKIDATIDVGAGDVRLTQATSSDPARNRGIESARLLLTYDAERRRLDMRPSTIRSGGSHMVLVGTADQKAAGDPWNLRVEAKEGSLSPSQPGIQPLPLELFTVDGRFEPTTGRIEVTRGVVKAGGTEIKAEASLPGPNETAEPRLDVRLGPMSHVVAKALWPALVAPGARAWVANRLTRATVVGGAIRLEPALTADGKPAPAGARGKLAVTIEMADVEVAPLSGFATIEAPRALIRLDHHTLDVTMPDAALVAGPQKRVGLKGGRFVIPDVTADAAVGELSFRLVGPVAAALAALDREPIALGSKAGGALDGLEGKVDGQMRMVVPLEKDVLLRDVQLDGHFKITEGRAKGLIGGYDMQAATLSLDVADEGIEVKGDMLVQGVSAKISVQHLLRNTSDRPQPPIRLTATLDANDRTQLGLGVNPFVVGDVAIEVTVPRGKAAEAPKVRADLTAAELSMPPIAWTKPAGRAAILTFDVARLDPAKGSKYKTELQNFKIVGEDIAADGWMGLDQTNKLREIYFPEIALNLISRLEIQGALRPDNIWDVRVKGPTLDGREIFRSLFSVGQAGGPAQTCRSRERPEVRERESGGIDLRAEIDTLLGFGDISMKGIRLQLARRGDRLAALSLKGAVDGGRPLDMVLQAGPNQTRTLLVTSDDAGQAFRMIGFYPNLKQGKLRLTVNLDGRGPAEKTGRLDVTDFSLLGDPVLNEVLSGNEDGLRQGTTSGVTRARPKVTRQEIYFDSVTAPFSVGYGQFVIEEADLRGPVFGANLRGKADFRSQRLNLAGTYAPLQGLNAAVGAVPLLGQLLTGQRGEGVFAITFAIQGPMAQPQVLVNPFSLLTPGFLREITQLSYPSTEVTPNADCPPSKRAVPATRASSAPAVPIPSSAATPAGSGQTSVGGTWTSGTETTPTPSAPKPAQKR